MKFYFISWKETYVRNSFIHASRTAQVNYVQNTLRRHLNSIKRNVLGKCMSKWIHYTTNRRHKRLRVIRLMQTSRVAICRSAVRLWKIFVHSDRVIAYKTIGYDRLVLSKLRSKERLHLKKYLYAWHKCSRETKHKLGLIVSFLKAMHSSLFQQAFSRWKYGIGIIRHNETDNIRKNRLLENYIESRRYNIMKRM